MIRFGEAALTGEAASRCEMSDVPSVAPKPVATPCSIFLRLSTFDLLVDSAKGAHAPRGEFPPPVDRRLWKSECQKSAEDRKQVGFKAGHAQDQRATSPL